MCNLILEAIFQQILLLAKDSYQQNMDIMERRVDILDVLTVYSYFKLQVIHCDKRNSYEKDFSDGSVNSCIK